MKKFAKVAVAALILLSLTPQPAISASAPKVVTPISISNSAGIGATIKLKPAKLNAVATRKYQWLLDGSILKGKTQSSIKLVSRYQGKALSVLETDKFKNGRVLKSTSQSIRVGVLQTAGTVRISFTDSSNTALKATIPASNPRATSYGYEWSLNPEVFLDGLSPQLPILNTYIGKTASVKITYYRDGFEPVVVNSEPFIIPVPSPVTETLLWSQEFNGAASARADSAFWSNDIGDGCSVGNCGWGNGERQWYNTAKGLQDGDGNFAITATKGQSLNNCYYGSCEWESAKLTTKGKIGFKYGRIEARIKGAAGQGPWPAFWMLGANYREVPGQSTDWPFCGEIDIFEAIGSNPNYNYGTPHSPTQHTGGQGYTGGNSLAYHTYAIDWAENKISWLIDGVEFYQITKAADYANDFYPFNQEFYVIVNMAIGGGFGGYVDPNLNSATMNIDWIRYYKVGNVGQVYNH